MPLLTQHSCGRMLHGTTCWLTAWAPRPVPREFTPPVLWSWRRQRRRPGDPGLRKASGPGATTSQPRGSRTKLVKESRRAEPGWAHTRPGGPTPSAVLGTEHGLAPPLPRTTCRTQKWGREDAGTVLGARWAGPGGCGLARPPMPGLETSSGPTPGLCSGVLPDSGPTRVLPVSDPLLWGRPSHTHPCAAERPPALWLLAPGASCLAGPAGRCPASLPGSCLPACPEAPVKPQWLQPRAQLSLGNLLHLPTTLETEPVAHRAVLSLGGGPERIPIPSPTPGMKPQRSFFTLRLTDAQDWVRSWGRGCRDRARC